MQQKTKVKAAVAVVVAAGAHNQLAFLRSQKGFTFIEVIIASSLMAIVILMGVTGLLFISKSTNQVKRVAGVEEDIQDAEALLGDYLTRAVRVQWSTSPIGNIGGGAGRIRNYNSVLRNAATPPVALAVFLREVGRPSQSSARGELSATGIYFTEPTPNTAGELSFSTSRALPGTVTLSPNVAFRKISNLVEFEIDSAFKPIQNGASVKVVAVRMVFRRFSEPDQNLWRWCPNANTSAACRNRGNFKDIVRTLQIPLSNNAIETSRIKANGEKISETIFGKLYFFELSE